MGHKKKKRYRGRNYHHLTNKCYGGKDTTDNLILIHIERHRYWHKVFKNMNLDQAIALLKRLKRIKEAQNGDRKCGNCV